MVDAGHALTDQPKTVQAFVLAVKQAISRNGEPD